MPIAAGQFIEVFHGRLSPNAAEVYAVVAGIPGGKPWALTGRIRGPECRHARTIPATYSFTDCGDGENLMAKVTIPDPCFWSPDLPSLYRVNLELRHAEQVVRSVEQEFGMRFLGTRGSSFFVAGKRWVLRAIHRDVVTDAPLQEWREAGAAMVVDNPSDEFCRETSREGVMLVARILGGSRVVAEPIASAAPWNLSLWASVGFVIASSQIETTALKPYFPNTILANTDSITISGDPWSGLTTAAILDVTAAGLKRVGDIARLVPTIAMRRLQGIQSLEEARAACDLLQRDLAPYGDCAGYIV